MVNGTKSSYIRHRVGRYGGTGGPDEDAGMWAVMSAEETLRDEEPVRHPQR